MTQPIVGYRELTEEEVTSINSLKRLGELIGTAVRALEHMSGADQRWVSIAQTHLQQGIMAAVRAVAKPETF